jgi:hypothetical protein
MEFDVRDMLLNRLEQVSAASPGINLFVVSTATLFPLVRYCEVLFQGFSVRFAVFGLFARHLFRLFLRASNGVRSRSPGQSGRENKKWVGWDSNPEPTP